MSAKDIFYTKSGFFYRNGDDKWNIQAWDGRGGELDFLELTAGGTIKYGTKSKIVEEPRIPDEQVPIEDRVISWIESTPYHKIDYSMQKKENSRHNHSLPDAIEEPQKLPKK